MLSCKQFLQELNDYLDESLDPQVRAELTRHVNECPNCWVLCNTTERTLKVFKGYQPKAVPPDMQARLLAALERRIADRGPLCGGKRAESPAQQPEQAGEESDEDCFESKNRI